MFNMPNEKNNQVHFEIKNLQTCCDAQQIKT